MREKRFKVKDVRKTPETTLKHLAPVDLLIHECRSEEDEAKIKRRNLIGYLPSEYYSENFERTTPLNDIANQFL